MTAELAHALRETADRALVRASFHDHYEKGAHERLVAAALNLADAVLRGERTEGLATIYADARAEWITRVETRLDAFTRAQSALKSAMDSEAELARANPFTAEEESWTNERALQQAATEKEAHNA